MRKRLTVLLAALLAVITGVFFAGCDIGLNDIAENENNPLESMFKEFLQDLDWKEYLTEDEIREILNSVDPKDFLTKERWRNS